MRLTALWPNKTLLWKEWKSIWVLAVLFAGYVTYQSGYTLLNEIMLYKDAIAAGYHYYLFQTDALLRFDNSLPLGVTLFVVALGAMMVGLERDQKTYDLLLAMPYTRWEIIHNKFLLGSALLLVVFVFNALVMTLLVWANPEVQYSFGMAAIWAWTLRYLVVLGFVFAFTMLISSMSGTTLGNGILAFIFLLFPFGITGLITINLDYWHLYQPQLWDLRSGLMEWGALLSVPTYLSSNHPIDRFSLAWVYGIVAVITVASYLATQHLFARNQMEYNGEILMFGKLEGFFKLGVAVCFALLGGPFLIYRSDLSPVAGIISYVVVGVLFWFAVTGIINWKKKANLT